MRIRIEIDQKTLVELVLRHLESKLGSIKLSEKDVRIETKSQQNYKSEWEKAEYRAVYERQT
jgi:hypothetical protein